MTNPNKQLRKDEKQLTAESNMNMKSESHINPKWLSQIRSVKPKSKHSYAKSRAALEEMSDTLLEVLIAIHDNSFSVIFLGINF